MSRPRGICIAAADYSVAPWVLQAQAPERYPFLLESAARDGQRARYDILFSGIGEQLSADGAGGFLDRLDLAWSAGARAGQATGSRGGLPFVGGWFLYLGYELAGEIEPRLQLPSEPRPAAIATRCRAALIRDHHLGQAWLVAEQGAEALLGDMARDLRQAAKGVSEPVLAPAVRIEEDPPERYREAVRRARAHIGAGDVFQANLSRAWQAHYATPPDPLALYLALCRSNPGPFAGIARWPEFTVVSSSPERLLKVDGELIESRPIAGTRPRERDDADDRRRQRSLHRSPKERAEHVMLIDLERNDLGRVCVGGSVRVDEFMALESYAHVHHIVSNVSGRLRPDVTPGQAIAALFPGGTITGCPKVRCMELIAQLEGRPRGPYTGSMGYLGHDGSMDLNILIRTLVQEGDRVSLRAGAGIVADSRPNRELAETRAKARGLLLALGEAAACG
ncbi:MAG: aminodeoxychorismate synthase component I [Gammaproteobacteria bacterium]|nr:aminodeoxychorismate synthase component I [Gammaproteobacteria bacterium]TVQ46037.1 MAG: aminodeoxychorismate synthase component I [Gammaproteobacteria bacterium]